MQYTLRVRDLATGKDVLSKPIRDTAGDFVSPALSYPALRPLGCLLRGRKAAVAWHGMAPGWWVSNDFSISLPRNYGLRCSPVACLDLSGRRHE